MKNRLLGGLIFSVLALCLDAQETQKDYRLGEYGLINFDLTQAVPEQTASSSIDLNKINGSKEKQKSAFDALDMQIKKLEEFTEKICQEIKTLKQNLEETKQAVQAHNDGLTRSFEAKKAEMTALILDLKATSTQIEPKKEAMAEVITVTTHEIKQENSVR